MYCDATAAHPQQQQIQLLKPGLPDISELSTHLQQEWHPDNNGLLGGVKIKPQSSLKVMWSCSNCPAGCPHIWKTSALMRTRGTKCSYCQGRALCQHNSLATKAPRQTESSTHDKTAKTPEQMLAGSHIRAEWKCPTCSRGKVRLHSVCRKTAAVLFAAKLVDRTQGNQCFKQRNTHCCLNGTFSATHRMGSILMTPRLAAAS